VTITRLLPRRASLLLKVAKALVIGAVMVALVSGCVATSTRAHNPSALRLDVSGEKSLQRAMTEHQCTTTGFGDSASPRSGLIRLDGRLRHVSFERAWSVFTGEQPGELVAVCLSEPSVAVRTVSTGA
jgi:hypothetical protein